MVHTRNIAVAMLALIPAAGCSGIGDNPVPPLEIGSSARLLSLAPANATLVDGAQSRSELAYPKPSVPVGPSRGAVTRAPIEQQPPSGPTSLASEQDVMLGGAGETSWDERRDQNTPMTLEGQAASLEPPASLEPSIDAPEAPAPVTAAPAPPASDMAAAAPGAARMALAEVAGVGPNAAEPLATRFGAQAKARNLTFTTASDTNATHVVKGYFSTTEEGGQVFVTYVWDITDRSGNRLHRIQGKEPGGGAGSGWDGVTAEAMQRVADRSIVEMADFVAAGAV